MKLDAKTKIISVFLLSSASFASDKILLFVYIISLAGFIFSSGIRIKSLKFALPVFIFSLSVFILKAVSYQNGFIFNIKHSWILPAKILSSSYLGILMILSTDMLSLSKAVSFLISPFPFLKYFGINTVLSLSALNVKMFSTIWDYKLKAAKSRSAVLSPRFLTGFSISMITAALRHSEETALALESRNYTGELKSGFTSMRLIDYTAIIFSIAAFLYAVVDFIILSRQLFNQS